MRCSLRIYPVETNTPPYTYCNTPQALAISAKGRICYNNGGDRMSNMTKQAVGALMQQREVGYFEGDIFEVRSFWKETCVEVQSKDAHDHDCPVAHQSVGIKLHPFKTIYDRRWMIGGCSACKKVFYYPIPLT